MLDPLQDSCTQQKKQKREKKDFTVTLDPLQQRRIENSSKG